MHLCAKAREAGAIVSIRARPRGRAMPTASGLPYHQMVSFQSAPGLEAGRCHR